MLLRWESVWVEACVTLVECGVEDTERKNRRCPGVEKLVFLDGNDGGDEAEGAPSRRVNDPCKTSPDPSTCTLSGRLRLTGGESGGKVSWSGALTVNGRSAWWRNSSYVWNLGIRGWVGYQTKT